MRNEIQKMKTQTENSNKLYDFSKKVDKSFF